VIVTNDGVSTVPNPKIKTARYNAGEPLNISFLPATGRHFKNSLRRSTPAGRSQRNLFFDLSLGTHFAFLSDWKQQYVLDNGKNPTTYGLQFNSKMGILVNSKFKIGLGYEYFFLPKVKVRNPATFDDRVSSQFLFLVTAFMHQFTQPSLSSIYAGLDIGLLKGKESFKDSQVELTGKGQTFAVRAKVGFAYHTRIGQVFFETGYLFGKINNVELFGQEVADYALDYSGITLSSGIRFFIPLN